MGCKCSDNCKERELVVRENKCDEVSLSATTNAQVSQHPSTRIASMDKLIGTGSGNNKILVKSLSKEGSLPDTNYNLNMQRSINQFHLDPTKFVMHSDVFKRENKQSIYTNYEILTVIGKGILPTRFVWGSQTG